jgi:hypothetical protein
MNLNINTQVDMDDLIDLEKVAQAIQDCMEWGEERHEPNSWQDLSLQEHIAHAVVHAGDAVIMLENGEATRTKRELQHAMTRLAMAYVLLMGGK